MRDIKLYKKATNEIISVPENVYKSIKQNIPYFKAKFDEDIEKYQIEIESLKDDIDTNIDTDTNTDTDSDTNTNIDINLDKLEIKVSDTKIETKIEDKIETKKPISKKKK